MHGFARRAAGLLAAFIVSFPAFAQNTYSAYVDSDANPATGCTATFPGGTFSGAEFRVDVAVVPGAAPTIGAPTRSTCSGGTFGGAAGVGGSAAIGLNTGVGGADVIEIGVPETAVRPVVSIMFAPVGFSAANAGGSDVLFPAGAGISYGIPPALPVPALSLLGGALLLIGVVLVARRAVKRSRLLLLSLFAFAGVAIAANFVVDGQVFDWAGETLHADPVGDPTNGQASIDIVAAGAEAENGQVFFRFDIRDLQNQPPVAVPQAVTTSEDTAVQITLSGSDAEGAPLTFAIASPATRGTLSAITPLTATTARVTYTPNPNTNGADSFTFTVNDGQINSIPATVGITVTPVNDAPTVNPATFAVVEDSPAGTVVGTATATDVDTGQTHTWSITAGNTGNAFTINPATGEITVLTQGAITIGNSPFTLTVQATDSGTPSASSTGTITINVTGVNDPPSFTAGPNQTIAEDAGAQTVDPWATGISAGPPDEAGQTITFQVTNNTNAVLFSAGPAVSPTGVLTYTPAANATGTATITIVAVDSGGTAGGGNDTSAPQSFTITVTPVNDAPVVTPSGAAANFMEGGSPVVADPNIVVTDVDSASLAGATVAITANYQTGADVLAFTPVGTITGSFSAATGTLTLSGPGTLAEYQAALRSVTFGNSSASPTTVARTLTWTATDGTATSAPATSFVTINNIDSPPTAVDDAATVPEDAPATAIPVLANDTDPDAGPISVASVTQPANGTVVITGGGTGLTYQPNANFCTAAQPPPEAKGFATDTFTYTLAPGGSVASVTMTVTCVDDAPVAVADAATVAEDTAATPVNVLGNDTDVDSGPITVASVTQPANGTVVNNGFSVDYTPNANYCSPAGTPDTFTYTLAPGGSTATVSMTVTCSDDPPTAVDDAATVGEDSSPNTLLVLANDTDIDAGPIAIASVTQPANGVVAITGGGASLTYTPNADYCNSVSGVPDTFTYTLTPGGSTATVSVTVPCGDDPPVAVDDSATVVQGSGPNAIPVLANDTDADGGPIAIGAVTQPANGAVVITGGGTGLTYQPNAGYCNTPPGTTPDTFTYSLNPGGSTATVSVSVTCDAPPVAVADSATVSEDSAANAIDVLANDTDTDGGPIAVASVTQPANGTVAITGGGTGVSYTPNPNYCNNPPGTTLETFTYTLAPGGSTATVTVTVTCADDPPVAVADTATVVEDSGANAINVLANDTDADGGPISVTSVTQPANGVVVITGGGTGLSYSPNANYCNDPPGAPLDTFTYSLTPGGSTTNVSVTVTCVDDVPVANPQSVTTNEDTAVAITLTGSDPEGSPLTFAIGTGPTLGTLGAITPLSPTSATVTYTPNANANGADSFTFTVNDGTTTSPAATVSITVTAVDDPPVAVADSATVLEDSGASAIPVLANDTDVDAGPITVNSVTQPANGTVVITGGGTGLTYAPNLNYCNNPPGASLDTFTYTLAPGGSSTTVTMTVTCVNDPPVADDETFSGTSRAIGNTSLVVNDPSDGAPDPTGTQKTVTGDILDGDTDVDGPGPLTVTPGTFATNDGGSVVIEADGDFTFFPAAGTSCTDTSDFFDYTVEDSGAPEQTDTGRVTITIADCVWYVDSSLGTNGTGRSHEPFNVLTNINGAGGVGDADGTGQILFLYDGAYTGGLPLEASQSLFAQRHGLVVPDGGAGTVTLEPAGGGNTTISGGVVLGLNNTVQGIDLGNAATFALSGTTVGTATVNTATSGTINNTTGGAVSITGGILNVVFASITSTGGTSGINLQNVSGTFTGSAGAISNATGTTISIGGGSIAFTWAGTITDDVGQLVRVANETSGLKLFSGAITDGNNGSGGIAGEGSVHLATNGTSTIRFNGGLLLSTGGNAAFNASGGGTVEVCDEAGCAAGTGGLLNTIATTTGTALSVVNTNIGAGRLEFRSLASNGAPSGVVLTATGAAGGLVVAGNGGTCTSAATCTGGAIQNSSGPGMNLTGVGGGVSLTRMSVNNGGDDGIRGSDIVGFTLTSGSITSNGNAVTERGIEITNLSGTGTISGSVVSSNAEDNVFIRNTTGTLNPLTITGSGGAGSTCQINTTSAAVGNDGVHVIAEGNANVTVSVTNCRFDSNRGDHVQIATDGVASSTVIDATINNNTMTGVTTNLGGGITISPSGNSQTNFDVVGNNIQGAVDDAININLGTTSTPTSFLRGIIDNNVIGSAGVVDSGSFSANGITVATNRAGTTTLAIRGNTIRQYSNLAGIDLAARDAMGTTTGALNATITGNTIANPGTFALNGITMSSGAAGGDNYEVCLDIGGAGALANTVNGSGAGGGTDLRVRHRFEATVFLRGYTGGATDTTAVATYLTLRNLVAPTASAVVNTTVPFGGQFQNTAGGAACPQP